MRSAVLTSVRSSSQPLDPHPGPIVDEAGEFIVIDCQGCGYRHVSPMPEAAWLETWYREHHYADGTRDRIDYHERDREYWLRGYGDLLNEAERHLPSERREALDVGCGTGLFLEACKLRGWHATGVEPSRAAVEHCRGKGLHVLEELFPSPALTKLPRRDLVHLRNVLEHVPEPALLLEAAFTLLTPGGILIAGVPNDYNPLQRAVRAVDGLRPFWLAPPHHLNYFDFDSLEGLLLRCGFELVSRYASFPIDLFLAFGTDYTSSPELGRGCHLARARLEKTLDEAGEVEARRKLYRAFASAGFGREAIVIARRPTREDTP